MTQTANPLRQFFRQPAIYLRLPSNGNFWPKDSIDFPANMELPVLPMTAIDEITYRTPDALFNGQAVVSVIQSCVPNIKDAWKTPSIDINAILVALRIASYGHELEITSTCPKCAEPGDFNLDLRTVLDQIKSPDFTESIKHGDLEIFFKPMDYAEQHNTNHEQWQEQRLIQMIPSSDLPDDEKIAKLNEALQKLTKLTVNALKHSIACIKTPKAMVTETEFISEFLNNCDRKLFNQIRDQVIVYRESTEFKPMQLTCHSCEHQYTQALTLDMASFFRTRLLTANHSQVEDLLNQMEREANELKRQGLKMSWYMRGGATYDDVMNMSHAERTMISELIKDNLETTKNSKLPFF